MRKATILGAGLVGSVLAILLRRKGYEVTMYERRPDMRIDNNGRGRSINLALSFRGWKALEYAGISELIKPIALPMRGRYLHQDNREKVFQAYGKNGEAIYSVSRGELNKRLMTRAEEEGVTIHFNQRSHKVDVPQNIIYLTDEDGNEKEINCDLLFGADGAFSSLRTAYTHLDKTNYQQFYIKHGYKELTMPFGSGTNKWLIENDGLHIWPRHQFMMIALPNTDGSFTCTLFFPFEGNPSFSSIKTSEEFLSFMEQQFPDAYPLMPHLAEDFNENPTSSLVTIKIEPWHYQNLSCIIGDAAHAVVPFYGQGMNAGFEDCSTLYNLMEKHNENWSLIFEEYEHLRKPNGDAVAELSLLNFVEMRDKVADVEFLERKAIDKELGKLFPNRFNSVYEMVSFSHTPYSVVLRHIKAQEELLKRIQQKGHFFEQLHNPDFIKYLEQEINNYQEVINS